MSDGAGSLPVVKRLSSEALDICGGVVIGVSLHGISEGCRVS